MSVSRRVTLILLILCAALPAQRRVDPRNLYHRVVGVLHLTGSGTAADPLRLSTRPAGSRQARRGRGSSPTPLS